LDHSVERSTEAARTYKPGTVLATTWIAALVLVILGAVLALFHLAVPLAAWLLLMGCLVGCWAVVVSITARRHRRG
jgi:DMSO reductase anchor subunit